MSTYFIHLDNQQNGPFTIEELKAKNITRETLVWKEGMADWVKASELNELGLLFNTQPPPLKQTPPPVQFSEAPPANSRKNNNALKFLIGSVIIVGAAILIWNYTQQSPDNTGGYNSESTNSGDRRDPQQSKTPQELKSELADKEHEDPSTYLDVTATFRKNLIGETVLEGTIKNNATAAAFKDIVLQAEFLAPSGTVLSKKKFTKYEVLGPGYDVTFKFKTEAPKESTKVRMSVYKASVVE